ncbi:uncharacterized [Tachysurus ichikawai]
MDDRFKQNDLRKESMMKALLPPKAPPHRQRSVSSPPWWSLASHAFQGFAVLHGRLSGSAAIVRLPALLLIL